MSGLLTCFAALNKVLIFIELKNHRKVTRCLSHLQFSSHTSCCQESWTIMHLFHIAAVEQLSDLSELPEHTDKTGENYLTDPPQEIPPESVFHHYFYPFVKIFCQFFFPESTHLPVIGLQFQSI